MSLNDSKVREIIREEVKSIEERCAGYRKVLAETLADIIALERQHQVQATNIQQQIGDKCNAAGRWLADRIEDGPRAADGDAAPWYYSRPIVDDPDAPDGE